MCVTHAHSDAVSGLWSVLNVSFSVYCHGYDLPDTMVSTSWDDLILSPRHPVGGCHVPHVQMREQRL